MLLNYDFILKKLWCINIRRKKVNYFVTTPIKQTDRVKRITFRLWVKLPFFF